MLRWWLAEVIFWVLGVIVFHQNQHLQVIQFCWNYPPKLFKKCKLFYLEGHTVIFLWTCWSCMGYFYSWRQSCDQTHRINFVYRNNTTKKKSQVKAKLCTHGHNKRNIVMSKSDKKKRHSDKLVWLTNHSASMEQAGWACLQPPAGQAGWEEASCHSWHASFFALRDFFQLLPCQPSFWFAHP